MRAIIPLTILLLTAYSPQTKRATAPPADSIPGAVALSRPATDSTVVDLLAIRARGAFPPTARVVVPDDPVYHTRKTYAAIPLAEVLHRFSSFATFDPATT